MTEILCLSTICGASRRCPALQGQPWSAARTLMVQLNFLGMCWSWAPQWHSAVTSRIELGTLDGYIQIIKMTGS